MPHKTDREAQGSRAKRGIALEQRVRELLEKQIEKAEDNGIIGLVLKSQDATLPGKMDFVIWHGACPLMAIAVKTSLRERGAMACWYGLLWKGRYPNCVSVLIFNQEYEGEGESRTRERATKQQAASWFDPGQIYSLDHVVPFAVLNEQNRFIQVVRDMLESLRNPQLKLA